MPYIRNADAHKNNKTTILNMLRLHGPVSRIELTKLTKLSRATISLAVNELIEEEIILETDRRQSTGGRPATNLELAYGSHIVIGADLIDQTWILGAFDLAGNTIQTQHIPYVSPTPEAAIQALVNTIPDFISQLANDPVPIIGLAVPGLVDTSFGMIHSSNVLGWKQVDLGKMLGNKLSMQTVVLNRSRARGLAECRFGAGRKYHHMVYIGVDSGVGAGVYIHRELIHGALGGAGEIGHTTVAPDGMLCPCGNTGCLQMYAAAPAIEREARKLLRGGQNSVLMDEPGFDLQLLSAKHICRAADAGDTLSIQAVEHAAMYLGITMANLVNLLNPEAIILGGQVPIECTTYVNAAIKIMHQRAMNLLSVETAVHLASYGDIAGALGAAHFALDRHLDAFAGQA